MVSFSETMGGETGALLDYYFVYIFLLLTFGVIYYVGIFRLLYKAVQQIFIVAMMFGISSLWWLLVLNYWTFMQDTTFANPNANAVSKSFQFMFSATQDSNILDDVLHESSLMAPISEIILITGTTILLLSWLYRQLPMDLIPDCIPCIGKYDNMLAGVWLFVGALIILLGVYLQFNYVPKQNSSKIIFDYFGNFTENFRKFLKRPTDIQAEILGSMSGDVMVSLMKFVAMVKQSVLMIVDKLQVVMAKQEL